MRAKAPCSWAMYYCRDWAMYYCREIMPIMLLIRSWIVVHPTSKAEIPRNIRIFFQGGVED